MTDRFIRFFGEVGIDDVPLVGGKNASLGEMYRELTPKGILIPNGFAITAEAYRHALDTAGAWPALKAAFAGLDVTNVEDLARRAKKAREIVRRAGLPAALAEEIRARWASSSRNMVRSFPSPCAPRRRRRICRMRALRASTKAI